MKVFYNLSKRYNKLWWRLSIFHIKRSDELFNEKVFSQDQTPVAFFVEL